MLAILLASAAAGALAWQRWSEMKRRGEVEMILNNLETATAARFSELVPRIDPTDPYVTARLDHLFFSGSPEQKFGAALVLAATRDDCREYCYGRLLDCAPAEIEPVVQLLRPRMATMSSRLSSLVSTPRLKARPRRQPNSMTEDGAGRRRSPLHGIAGTWLVLTAVHLRSASSLVPCPFTGALGNRPRSNPCAAGQGAGCVNSTSLVQCLGEFPTLGQDEISRRKFTAKLMDLYVNDPDGGVHGSAKWLLLHVGTRPDVERLNETLRHRTADLRFSWRVSHSGLTLITIDSPELDRVIEIMDTEVTVATFKQFRQGFRYFPETSPEENSPINGVDYSAAAEFCNWLNQAEKIPADQSCYRLADESTQLWAPVVNFRDLEGFRLPTDVEFELACRAGTRTSRYHGDSRRLLRHYARYDERSGQRSSSWRASSPMTSEYSTCSGMPRRFARQQRPKRSPASRQRSAAQDGSTTTSTWFRRRESGRWLQNHARCAAFRIVSGFGSRGQ